MRKLNVWNRLGIVLTVLWLVIAPLVFVGRDNYNFSKFLEANSSQACWQLAEKAKPEDFLSEQKSCLEARTLAINSEIRSQLSYATYVGFSFALAAVVWVLAYIATYATRWILAGRKGHGST